MEKKMENFNDNENLNNAEKQYNELWDLLIDNNIATDDELNLISYINGWRLETLEDVLYVRTGYRDMQQYKEFELNEVDYE